MPSAMPAVAENPTRQKPRYLGWRVTREEYLDLEEDGFKYDVIDGEMTMAPSASFEHGEKEKNFLFVLESYLRKHAAGRLVPETEVLLPDGGDPLRPDVSFILSENTHIIKTHIHGAPDLICEVLSPSTRDRDLGVKADRYLACGVKEYWIIDLEVREIHLWTNPDKAGVWHKQKNQINADRALESVLLSGFSVHNRDIFD
jgi:Uma2 family endonuclease